MTKETVQYARYRCEGCGACQDVEPSYVRPNGWVDDAGHHYHDVECWWLAITSRRVIVQGRGTLSVSEAAEDYIK